MSRKGIVMCVVLFLFLIGCEVPESQAERTKKGMTEQEIEETTKTGEKWEVIRTEEDFLSRYPGLSTDYFNQVRQAELLFEEGENRRLKFESLTKKEDYPRRVELRDVAKSYYMQALTEARKVFDATENAGIASLIERINAPLTQIQREIEGERGMVK
jgi:hypothetical protein